jgi:hypothetical protein
MGFLLALFPGRLWGYVAIAGVIFGMGGTAAWKVQAWRITHIKAEHTQQVAEATAKVAAAEQANLNKQIEANNAKTKRETTIQAAAAAVRNERYGLRDVTGAFIAKATPITCNERAKAVAVVFDQCAGRLEEMAATADRLESDRQLLLESWPK